MEIYLIYGPALTQTPHVNQQVCLRFYFRQKGESGEVQYSNSRRQVLSVKNSVNLSHSSLLLPLLLQSQNGDTLILGERR